MPCQSIRFAKVKTLRSLSSSSAAFRAFAVRKRALDYPQYLLTFPIPTM